MSGLLSLYAPGYARVVVYMLQSTEYQVRPYLKWYWRTRNFDRVMRRRSLEPTRAARLLLMALRIGMLLQVLAGLGLLVLWRQGIVVNGWLLALSLLLSYPVVWAHLIVLPLLLGRIFIKLPKEKRLIRASRRIFADHAAVKIAVAGSYGKTSMKELLVTVLGESKKVAATPANKNVASSHASFASKLKGDEEVIIIEYGEGRPGDVARFTRTTKPTHGIITGLAPAHLDHYPSLDAAGKDIFSLADKLDSSRVYVNQESIAAQKFISKSYQQYGSRGVGTWKVKNVKINITGTSFTLYRGKHSLKLKSGLLGRHQIGPLSLAAVMGLELGLTNRQVEKGVSRTMAFEHRMQPRQIAGAWIIDDTYNGNIDGIRAGLALLKELPARRRIFITPGLVDQGKETVNVHKEMGVLIAGAKPDRVVLMDNSVAGIIHDSLTAAGYNGEVQIEEDPLEFYTNLDQFLAAGDLVLMQNDWTDNYS